MFLIVILIRAQWAQHDPHCQDQNKSNMRICLLSGYWILFLERKYNSCLEHFKRVNFDLDAIVRDLLTQPPSLADGKVRSQSY